MLESLLLKSAEQDASQESAHVVLCTDNITYQLRQVQSSNSIFVLQPTQTQMTLPESSCPVTSISAIAKCSDTLELLTATSSASNVLRQALPVYDVDAPNAAGRKTHKNKKELLENTPYSEGEFETSWLEMCAFEYDEQAWRPTAKLLADTWKSIVSAAIIRSLSLDDMFPIISLASSVEDEGLPRSLAQSLIARLSTSDADLSNGYARLDAERCIIWVGKTLLQSIGHEVQRSEFVNTWREQLPETWRRRASLNLLKVSKPFLYRELMVD